MKRRIVTTMYNNINTVYLRSPAHNTKQIFFSEVSEASFCGRKQDGNYQAPTTCQAYIACSYGVTSHVECSAGKKFDTVKRICVPADQAACTVVYSGKIEKL